MLLSLLSSYAVEGCHFKAVSETFRGSKAVLTKLESLTLSGVERMISLKRFSKSALTDSVGAAGAAGACRGSGAFG